MAAPAGSEDISKKFFDLCEELEVGEIVAARHFRLGDVMSAIELGEPKMDIGVGGEHILSMEEAMERGVLDEDFPLQVTIMDATFAMIVGWLEGSSITSTVWTNVMLADYNKVAHHPTFLPFVQGVNLFVRTIHCLISNVGNLEELPEDFSPSSIMQNTTWPERSEVCAALRKQSTFLSEYGSTYKSKTGIQQASDAANAVSIRLLMISLFLEIFAALLPPDIEDPNYHTKFRNYYVNPACETEKDDEKKEEASENKPASDENKEQAAVAPEPKNGDVLSEEGDFDDVEDEEEYDDETPFLPDFRAAVPLAESLVSVTQAYAGTLLFGKHSPSGEDGDFTWLPCFDQKTCIRNTPAGFPRSVQIPDRKKAAIWLVECTKRILDLTSIIPMTTKDLSNLFYYARTFTLKSCPITRALLQICMFPSDNHMCGDPDKTAAVPIEVSLRTQFTPQVLSKGSAVFEDRLAQKMYLVFLNNMTRVTINVYTSFGCNLSRQRDRLEMCLEELNAMQTYAMDVERRTDVVMVESGTVSQKELNPSYNSISTFVFHNMVALMHHYFEIAFRMDLFVPYEFPYIYWFLSEVEAKWMVTTLERSHEVIIGMWRANPLSTSVDKRQMKEKARQEEEIRQRLKMNQCSIINQISIGQICEGVVRLTIFLIRQGKIKMPPGGEAAERLRFERRFEIFERLGPPLAITYDDYLHRSNIAKMYELPEHILVDEALLNFTNAAGHLTKLDTAEMNSYAYSNTDREKLVDCSNILRCAKGNMIACRLLKMDMSSYNAEFGFNDEVYPMFPILKLTKR